MKIALVCPFDIAYPGGVASHVIQFAEYASRKGHKVTVIAPTSAKRNSGNVTFVSAGRPVSVPIASDTVGRLTFSLWNFPRIHKELKNGGYDVVHVHAPQAIMLGPAALSMADNSRSAIIVTFHTAAHRNVVMQTYGKLANAVKLNSLGRKIDTKIAVSESAKSFMSRYVPGDYIVIPNGIDTERFSQAVKPIEKYRDGKVNILFVGRLGNNEKRKGVKYLVSAFGKLQRRHKNIRLLVIGPGKPDYETQRLVGSLGSSNIVFVGGVSHEDLPRYYATADIFCSSATHGESFGIVLAEAMASGKPVVASNIAGYRAVMEGTGAGILVPPKKSDAIADALETLITDRKLRLRMGAKGRKFVVENFSWEKVAERILEVYANAIRTKTTRK